MYKECITYHLLTQCLAERVSYQENKSATVLIDCKDTRWQVYVLVSYWYRTRQHGVFEISSTPHPPATVLKVLLTHPTPQTPNPTYCRMLKFGILFGSGKGHIIEHLQRGSHYIVLV